MKEQCMICGSVVEDVSGICPVCGAVLGRSTQVNPYMGGTGSQPGGGMGSGPAYVPNGSAGYGQPGNAPNGGIGYGQPENANMGYGQMPYNYQNPGMPGAGKPKKKKLLSVLSIVMAALAVFTVCVPIVSILFAVASIVLGIIALVKKQIKVPAILGFVFSGIAMLLAVGMLVMNALMYAVCGTNIPGIFEQSIEAMEEDIKPLEGITFMISSADGDYYYSLFDNGAYIECFDSHSGVDDYMVDGTYENYGYVDESVRELLEYEVLAAMREGYHIKNVTCVKFNPNHYYVFDEAGLPMEVYSPTSFTDHLVFVVPDDYRKGGMFYQIEVVDSYDQKLTPIYPFAGGTEDILPDDMEENLRN